MVFYLFHSNPKKVFYILDKISILTWILLVILNQSFSSDLSSSKTSSLQIISNLSSDIECFSALLVLNLWWQRFLLKQYVKTMTFVYSIFIYLTGILIMIDLTPFWSILSLSKCNIEFIAESCKSKVKGYVSLFVHYGPFKSYLKICY